MTDGGGTTGGGQLYSATHELRLVDRALVDQHVHARTQAQFWGGLALTSLGISIGAFTALQTPITKPMALYVMLAVGLAATLSFGFVTFLAKKNARKMDRALDEQVTTFTMAMNLGVTVPSNIQATQEILRPETSSQGVGPPPAAPLPAAQPVDPEQAIEPPQP